MCGFAAIVETGGGPVCRTRLRAMTAALRHRGPDDEAYLLADRRAGRTTVRRGRETGPGSGLAPLGDGPELPWTLGIGVRRLAIREPAGRGRQPMGSPDGACWLVYNGELYGADALRDRLASGGWRFAGRSDTEVLLAGWHALGPAVLGHLDGMWAFLLWDGVGKRLYCVRDAFGIKPLYFVDDGARVLVGSEIKALRAGLASAAPHWPAVVDYLSTGLTDHREETCYAGMRRVRPGHMLVVDREGLRQVRWAAPFAPRAGPGDGVERFHAALDGAVRSHLESDRVVGAALSGGLDSGTIVLAAGAALAGRPLDVFTAVFGEPALDEAEAAGTVARAAAARVHVVDVGPRALVEQSDRWLAAQGEPVVSTSVFAQWCVARAAASAGVVVLLDGQGADELLAGYPAQGGALIADLARRGQVGRAVRELAHGRGLPVAARAAAAVASLLPPSLRAYAARVAARQLRGIHPELHGYWRPLPAVTDAAAGPLGRVRAGLLEVRLPPLLRYLDHNAMAWSVEARVPFLSREVVEAGLALRSDELLADGFQKWVLRDPRVSRLPEAIRAAPRKQPFATPEAAWWRGPLQGWLADRLTDARVRRQGVLDAGVVARAVADLQAGRPVRAPFWRWVNVSLWLEALGGRTAAPGP